MPLTIVALLEKCQELKAKAVVITGANSQVGKTMAEVLKQNNIPSILVVRK